MKSFLKILPWLFVALFAAEIIAVMMPKADGEYHVRAFGRLPALLNGRIQPFDSVARNSLLQIRSTRDVPLEEVPSWKFWHHPKKLKATEWLLEVMTRPDEADDRPIFLIHHSELLGELKLENKGKEKSGLRYYTFNEIAPMLSVIETEGRKANEVKAEQQSTYQKQVTKLANAVMLYRRLKYSLEPEDADNFLNEIAQFRKDLGPARQAAQAAKSNGDVDQSAIEKVAVPVRHFQAMSAFGYPLPIPPEAGEAKDHWVNVGAALLDSVPTDSINPAAAYYVTMATAYHEENAEQFNQAIADYNTWLKDNGFDKAIGKGRAEFYYNDVNAFLHSSIIYVFAFVLAGFAFVTLNISPAASEALRRSSFYLIILAWLFHTFGLVFRMILAGRPPVTNLYSSAIFIGWGAVVLGIILERIYRVGIGNIVAAFAGFVTLLIAHNLSLDGDTMEMLRAVLDTNFWLATHVVVVTLGYASTFVAGLLAITYIFLGLITPLLTQKLKPSTENAGISPKPQAEIGKALAKMVYGIICFATLFSFTGTVLGGIWADQSWGRFWGWDPKENGALLIVLWNAIMLHARWGGLVRERGLMALAVFGNIVTSFSWFGVNMLGIGLHSYGFMDAAFKWLMIFVGSQVVIILLGLIPLRFWKSFKTAALPSMPGGRDPGGALPARA
jgi:cytochrome c-type biogenesis protein CcsB